MDNDIQSVLWPKTIEASLVDYFSQREQAALRDQFAMAALTGLLTDPRLAAGDLASWLAARAFQYADAMLEARKLPQPTEAK